MVYFSFYPLAHCPEKSVIDVYPFESVLYIYNYTSTFIIYELLYNKDIYVIKIYINFYFNNCEKCMTVLPTSLKLDIIL